eukprot:scaffold840_cov344-Pavlova_lutheri.AAC.68
MPRICPSIGKGRSTLASWMRCDTVPNALEGGVRRRRTLTCKKESEWGRPCKTEPGACMVVKRSIYSTIPQNIEEAHACKDVEHLPNDNKRSYKGKNMGTSINNARKYLFKCCTRQRSELGSRTIMFMGHNT